jgi:hypothetical protein
LHFLFERPESLFDIVIANEYLQNVSNRGGTPEVSDSIKPGSNIGAVRRSRKGFNSGLIRRIVQGVRPLSAITWHTIWWAPTSRFLQLDQSQAERLETNTSMPHMIRATSIWSWRAACTDPRQTVSGLPLHFH